MGKHNDWLNYVTVLKSGDDTSSATVYINKKPALEYKIDSKLFRMPSAKRRLINRLTECTERGSAERLRVSLEHMVTRQQMVSKLRETGVGPMYSASKKLL